MESEIGNVYLLMKDDKVLNKLKKVLGITATPTDEEKSRLANLAYDSLNVLAQSYSHTARILEGIIEEYRSHEETFQPQVNFHLHNLFCDHLQFKKMVDRYEENFEVFWGEVISQRNYWFPKTTMARENLKRLWEFVCGGQEYLFDQWAEQHYLYNMDSNNNINCKICNSESLTETMRGSLC